MLSLVLFQNDSSFELSEKVQNSTSDNNQINSNATSEEIVNNKLPSDDLTNKKQSSESIQDAKTVSAAPSPHYKSVRQQVEDLASEQNLGTEFEFVKPPGFIYKIGCVK